MKKRKAVIEIPSVQIPQSLAVAASWSWRFLLVAASLATTVWALSRVSTLVISIAIALLLSLPLISLRNLLTERARLPRKLSIALTILLSLAITAWIIWFTFGGLFSMFAGLASQTVLGINAIRDWFDGPPLNIDNVQFDELWGQLQTQIQNAFNADAVISGALGAAGTLQTLGTGLMVVLFSMVFFLIDGRIIWLWIVNLLPESVRERLDQASRRGVVTLSAYVRTQIVVAAVDGIGIGIGMLFFVPSYALPIAILVFLGGAIPVLGALFTGFVAALVVLVSQGWVSALIMVAIVLLVQQLESNVLSPLLLGHAVSLHPWAVFLSVIGGSMLAGITGAIIAVPLVAVANTMIQYFLGHDKFPELGTESSQSLPDGGLDD